MNLVKCLIGIVYIGIVLLITGMEAIDGRTYLVLIGSGVLGIALGDSFFFKALVNLGPKLTVLLGTLGPVLTIIMAVALLHERPSGLEWVGAALTLAGVNYVLWEDMPSEEHIKRKYTAGVFYAVLAGLCMSLGIITAKVGVAEASAIQATFIRIIAASVALAFWGLVTGRLQEWVTPFKDPPLLRLILFSVFVVIFGGFWLSLVALKYIDASLATILNSTEPIFILPLVALLLKEKITVRAMTGSFAAVVGVALIFTG
jgi:drug/metabolite transporter (DMT)-like permease